MAAVQRITPPFFDPQLLDWPFAITRSLRACEILVESPFAMAPVTEDWVFSFFS